MEMGVSESYIQRCIDYSNGIEAGDKVYPGFRQMIFTGKLKFKDQDVEKIAKLPEEKRAAYVRSLVEGPADPDPDKITSEVFEQPETPVPVKSKKKSVPITLPLRAPVPLVSDLEDAMLSFWKVWKEKTKLHEELLREENCRDEVSELIEECRDFLEEYEKRYL